MIPKIAIIHTDTLSAIGLKTIIQDAMPSVEIDVFRSVDELKGNPTDSYFHYFVSTSVLTGNTQFFSENRRKTIVLSASTEANPLLAGYKCLCTAVPEKQLIKSLLTLEQSAHASGRNLPPSIYIKENKLSVREIEVMTLIVKGYINKEIADRLNIGLSTVVTHRRNIMEKLGIKSVSALTIYAVTHGYVDICDI